MTGYLCVWAYGWRPDGGGPRRSLPLNKIPSSAQSEVCQKNPKATFRFSGDVVELTITGFQSFTCRTSVSTDQICAEMARFPTKKLLDLLDQDIVGSHCDIR